MIQILPDTRIKLSDGVELSALLFLPAGELEPRSTVFTLSPYTADNYYKRGRRFAEEGIAFLAVDTRGRGNSDGVFDPFRQELVDGPQIVEWITAQTFSNGQVAMAGGSYCGTTQWVTAAGHPQNLATIVPTASAHAGIDFPTRTGIGYQYLLQWLALVNGNAAQAEWFSDADYWQCLWRDRFERGASYRSLADELGGDWPQLEMWIDRLEKNDFSDIAPSDAQLAGLDIPILTITGSYDDDQPGALEYYKRHTSLAKPEAAARHYLLIGPWDHAGTRTPQRKFGGVEFGEPSVLNMDDLHLEWFRWTMGDGPPPELLKQRVTYYVMGAERWRYCDTLEEATHSKVDYALDSDGEAHRLFGSGTLKPGHSAQGPADGYAYDPTDTSIAEAEMGIDNEDPAEQRMVFARDGRQLVYHSDAFDQAIEITGFFELIVWLSLDAPDTDFAVRVYEITKSGSSFLLTSDLLRARHRNGRDKPCLIESSEPLEYHFNQFTWVSRKVAKGSRLRLTIGPNDSIYAQKNFNSGREVSSETMEDARTANVRLFHDSEHASVLRVPIGRKEPS